MSWIIMRPIFLLIITLLYVISKSNYDVVAIFFTSK